jgi:hypothetical protein
MGRTNEECRRVSIDGLTLPEDVAEQLQQFAAEDSANPGLISAQIEAACRTYLLIKPRTDRGDACIIKAPTGRTWRVRL